MSSKTTNHLDTSHFPRRAVNRVIKSKLVLGLTKAEGSVALPLDAPFRSGTVQTLIPAAGVGRAPEPSAVEIERLHRSAVEAEARAQALQRRATALLEEVERVAAARIAEAVEEATTLLAQSANAVEEVYAEARSTGFTAGHEEGLAAGLQAARAEMRAQMADAARESEALITGATLAADREREQAAREREAYLGAVSSQVLDLVLVIARQVLKAEMMLTPAQCIPMIEAALSRLKGDSEPVLRVSDALRQVVEEHRSRLLAAAASSRMTVESDPSLLLGDFTLSGEQGQIDGRIERQVSVIGKVIFPEESL